MNNEENPSNIHRFWSTQPVPQSTDDRVVIAGPLDKPKSLDEIPDEPYPIASTLEWWTPNLEEPSDLQLVYELLRDNYVEDSESMFRFNYSSDFLKFALTPPGYVKDWHVSVRRKNGNKLVAFVAGIPLTMMMGTPASLQEKAKKQAEEDGAEVKLYEDPRRICEINFLCVHKQLREKRLAPILIKEVTRRVNKKNIWQAVYTAGTVVPTPFSTAQYYHRALNPEKLVEVGFSGIKPQFRRFQNPMAMFKRAHQLPRELRTKNLREMRREDVPQVRELLNESLKKYDVFPVFDNEEIEHYLMPRDGVMYTYVLYRDDKITDFFSFYSLQSTIIGNSKYSILNTAYVHYYVATTVPLQHLITDLLIIAKEKGFDVCNMVDILENQTFCKELKFGQGDGQLHYYFYNWAYPKLPPTNIALVML